MYSQFVAVASASPFMPQHQYTYSPYCSLYISQWADKEILFYYQELL